MRLHHTTFAVFCLGLSCIALSACFGSVGNTDLPEPAVHRGEPIACDNVRDSPPVNMSGGQGCASHEECTEGANGRCLPDRFGNSCSYDGCFEDSECGGPCVCGVGGAGANFCTSGGCQVDADCGPGGWCSPTFGSCGLFGGVVAFECHTANDECTDDSDCSDLANGYCTFAAEAGHWVCGNTQCEG